MERTRDTVLLALYALPAPPDGKLVDRRAAAAKEQGHGGAATRAVEDEDGRGGDLEAGVSLGGGRVDRLVDPSRKGRKDDGAGAGDRALERPDEPACGRGGVEEEVSCDGVAPRHVHLDVTRKGRRHGTAEDRASVDAHLCGRGAEEHRPRGGRSDPPNRDLDATQKGCRAGSVEKEFLVDKDGCGHGVEEDHPHGGRDVLPGRCLDATQKGCGAGAAGEDTLVDKNPHGRRAKGSPCGGDIVPNSSGHIDCSACLSGGQGIESLRCHGLKEDVHCGSKAASRSRSRVADAMNPPAGLGAAAQQNPAPTSSSLTATNIVDKYDPAGELIHCKGEVLSDPWGMIWRSSPLVFHDLMIARYCQQGVVHDLTDQITNILEKHPGPVAYFRLDSTSFGGRTQLSGWLRKLSQKSAVEIVIVNRSEDPRFEFPLEDVQSSCLKSLRLGFFTLSDLDLNCFEYSNLDTLDLMGCAFETIRLYQVVKNCSRLTHLGIGLAVKAVRISSASLEHLQIWRCSMTHVSVEYAPRLRKIVNGVRSPWKGHPVLVMVNGTQDLLEFDNLLLPLHKVEDLSWLKTLRKIKLGIQMDCHWQRKLMCECLRRAETLQELFVWRVDEIGLSEELDVLVDDSLLGLCADLPCFRTLQVFEMEGFRGGAADIAIAVAVLKYAVSLKNLRVRPCPDSSEEAISKAVTRLCNTKRASVKCLISVLKIRPGDAAQLALQDSRAMRGCIEPFGQVDKVSIYPIPRPTWSWSLTRLYDVKFFFFLRQTIPAGYAVML